MRLTKLSQSPSRLIAVLGRQGRPVHHADYHDPAFVSRERHVWKLSGDHIWKATPVPIPNTVVKLPEPMVVPKARE